MNPGEYRNLEAAEERMWWFRGMRSILLALVDEYGGEVREALEVGCGTGAVARLLQARNGWRVTPTDVSAAALEAAWRLGGARLVGADALALPFPAASFDAVVTLDMMVHLEPGQERSALSEFARVVRPGGLLILRAAAFRALRSRHSEYVGERQRFRLGQLKEACGEAGFDVVRATYANMLLLPVALVKFRLVEPLMRAEVASGVGLGPAWLESLLYAALALESRSIQAGLNLPVGQTAIVVARRRG